MAPATLDGLLKPVVEVCEYYGTVPWQLSPREVDRYFTGPGKRAPSTLRGEINKIDAYFAFLEQRCAGEITRRFGAAVESPIDPFNRPRHRRDFGLRIPPSQTAMWDFLGRWREDLPNARKYLVACRDYLMTKVAYLSGVRAASEWLTYRHRRWPASTNPHLLVSQRTALDPDHPPVSMTTLHRALPKGVPLDGLRQDRILNEAFETGDPLKLMRLFGITEKTAMHYAGAAHPERTAKLPRWRSRHGRLVRGLLPGTKYGMSRT